MTFREKLPYLIIIITILTISAFFLNERTAFTGDEFGTLDIENIHKPIPYHGIVSNLLDYLHPITPENIFHIRLSSLFFTVIGIFLWFLYFLDNRYEIFIFSVIIITSGFLLRESIFFRYYSYYFLSSTITFLCLVHWAKKLNTNQKLIIGLLGSVISPYFFYVLNALQFAFYFVYIFIFEKIQNIKLRLILFVFPLSFILLIAIKPKIIWTLFNWLNIIGHANIDMTADNVHGITKSVIIKPFYAVYQMIIGYDIAPTSSILIFLLFIFVSMLIAHQLYRVFMEDKDLFLQYSVICIVPFLMIYLFFQVISLPGFTQLETKHGMLMYPLLIALIVKSRRYASPMISYLLVGSMIICQATGTLFAYNKKDVDWNYIIKKIDIFINSDDKVKILMDGRSSSTFTFYDQHNVNDELIQYTWEPMDSLTTSINKNEKIVLLLNDYKSYTPLTIEQNWNAASSSLNRVKGLDSLLVLLNWDFQLVDSYINYPTFLYLLEKKERKNNEKSFGVWEHHLKDLILPVDISSREKIISSLMVQPGDSIMIKLDSDLVLNLENSKNINIGTSIGTITDDGKEIHLIKGENIWDIFAEFYDENVEENKVVHSWYHTPLVSGSIKYDGSYFKHKARIYSVAHYQLKGTRIKIINSSKISSIRVWI